MSKIIQLTTSSYVYGLDEDGVLYRLIFGGRSVYWERVIDSPRTKAVDGAA